MAEAVKKPFNLHHSQMLKTKPSSSLSGAVERIKTRLTEYRYDVIYELVSSLQKSMNLQTKFDDAVSEYDVEVVCVGEDIEETFDYLRRKRNAGCNVVACVSLEVETRDRNLRITSKNNHLLEEDFPCDIVFDIRQTGVTSDEKVAERLSEIQPLAITKQRSEIINGWLEEYQEALKSIIVVCKDKNKVRATVHSVIKQYMKEEVFMNCLNFGETELQMKLQNRNVIENQPLVPEQFPFDELIRKFTQTIGEKLSRRMDEKICDKLNKLVSYEQPLFCMKDKYGRQLYDSVIEICHQQFTNTTLNRSGQDIVSRLFSISKAEDERIKENLTQSIQNWHIYIISALEKDIQIVPKLKLPIPDIQENRHCRKLTSVCCGWMDSTRRSSIGFRAESFDQIHVTIDRSIDAVIDKKTVRTATQETRRVDEYIHDNNLKVTHEDKRRLYKLVNKYSEELMEKHSNLNRIGISPVRSRKSGIVKTPCVVMYCSCKGTIPPDEPAFQRQIEKTPVDVREGYFSLFGIPDAQEYNDPLRIGISIGGKDMRDTGSLGPFVVETENKNSLGFLTCQHVFSSAKKGSQVTQPSVLDHKTDTRVEKTICGEIRSMFTGDVKYNGKRTSVDVAYVVIKDRIPKEFKFPDIPETMIKEFGKTPPRMGQPIIHLEPDDKVYKLGRTTGLTAGCFETTMAMVKWGTTLQKREERQNLYKILSDTEFAAHGDSGSGVFTLKDNCLSVIGLLLGGSDNRKECYVLPIGAALQAVEPRLEIHQFTDESEGHVDNSGADRPSDNASGYVSGVDADRPSDNASGSPSGVDVGADRPSDNASGSLPGIDVDAQSSSDNSVGEDCPALSRTVATFSCSK